MNTYEQHKLMEGDTRQGNLFDLPGDDETKLRADAAESVGVPRLRRANRRQRECLPYALDELLPEDHEARAIWIYVEGLDFTPLLQKQRAVEGHAGRSAIDPRIAMTLWLYATLKGVGSARELARLCGQHVVYRWIRGGVSVNHHTLADFRTDHGEFLDGLLTRSVAALVHEGLVQMERVAQDGMRVRASAGSHSFHCRPTLEKALQEAQQQVRKLKEELQANPGSSRTRQEAARERTARERLERVKQALERLPELEAKKKPAEKGKARVSTTDPEATTMKMANGGFNPAYNVQLATDTQTQIITDVEVITSGSDRGQLAPMIEQHQSRYEQVPEEALADGGFATKEDITEVEGKGTTVYAPVQKSKDPDRGDYDPRHDDSPAVAAWRQRMATPEAKEIYKQRASTAECVNALARNRNLQQFRVRGLIKIRAVALWYALVHNVMRVLTLRACAALESG
jgi:transposase